MPKGLTQIRRKTRPAIMLIGLMMASCACATAQISLSTAVDLALHKDPAVRVAQADLDKAKASLSETRDAYIPSVSMTGGYGDGTGAPLSVPVVFGMSSQSLLFNFSQRDNLRSAASGVEAAKLALQEVLEKVTEDVVVTYIDLDNAEQRQAAKKQAYGYATRLVTIVGDRLDAGQDTKIDLLAARQTAAQLNLDQLTTDDEVATLTEHLLLLLGIPGDHLETIPSSVPAMPDLSADVTDLPDSYGIRAAMATARSKQEFAFGQKRYKFRPEIALGANYNRVTTNHTDYTDYYPGFKGSPGHPNSDNALSVGIQVQIPLLDRGHEARAREAAADASHALFQAADQRNQFLEGRFKLQHSIAELSARIQLAGISREYAQAQLDAITVQLTPGNASTGGAQMTPKDEQNARLQEREKYVDFLNAQFQLNQVEINLLRQTGELDGWVKSASSSPASVSVPNAKP